MTMEMEEDRREVLPEGTETRWGTVRAVGWVGERYYWIIDRCGVVTMMPAGLVEEQRPAQGEARGRKNGF